MLSLNYIHTVCMRVYTSLDNLSSLLQETLIVLGLNSELENIIPMSSLDNLLPYSLLTLNPKPGNIFLDPYLGPKTRQNKNPKSLNNSPKGCCCKYSWCYLLLRMGLENIQSSPSSRPISQTTVRWPESIGLE